MRNELHFVAAVAIALFWSAPALADEEICDRDVSGGSFDDVKVPSGATCTLDGSKVKGNVQVESGGALVTTGTRVESDIQADEARYIQILAGTQVGGNVQIKKTTGVPPLAAANQVCDTKIGGDLQLDESEAPFEIGCSGGNRVNGNLQIDDSDVQSGTIVVANNGVRGDLQYKDNRTRSSADISDNTIGQNLQCSDNNPIPMGSGNVAGDPDDQCEDLATATEKDPRKVADLDDCDAVFEKQKFNNVTVPNGSTCTLDRVKVKGNVEVESGGALVATATKVKGNVQVESGGAIDAMKLKVKGNIQTDGASDVRILEAKVRGDVQIRETSGTPPGLGPNQVCASKIRSDLQVTKNTAPIELGCGAGNRIGGNLQVQDNQIPGVADTNAIAVTNNKVRGDLHFQDNTSAAGNFDISDNKIGQNLQCADNNPAPTGSGNRVKDDAAGQCADLTDR
jgi:hypothetical protein